MTYQSDVPKGPDPVRAAERRNFALEVFLPAPPKKKSFYSAFVYPTKPSPSTPSKSLYLVYTIYKYNITRWNKSPYLCFSRALALFIFLYFRSVSQSQNLSSGARPRLQRHFRSEGGQAHFAARTR